MNQNFNKMKKLFLMLIACCMMFVACNNQKTEEVAQEEQKNEQTCEKKDCCKDKHECCKKMMEDWKNFDNLTAEEQAKLIEMKSGFITDMLSKVNLDEIECPNAKQEIKDFQAKWEGFEKADQAGKKALIDEFDNAHWKHAVMPEKCCKDKEGCCDKDKEGCCKDKEGCCDKGKKEGCCDKK